MEERYLIPVHGDGEIVKESECDMLMMQPLIEMGLWKRVTKREVEEWKRKQSTLA